jgi:hypothetical protein
MLSNCRPEFAMSQALACSPCKRCAPCGRRYDGVLEYVVTYTEALAEQQAAQADLMFAQARPRRWVQSQEESCEPGGCSSALLVARAGTAFACLVYGRVRAAVRTSSSRLRALSRRQDGKQTSEPRALLSRDRSTVYLAPRRTLTRACAAPRRAWTWARCRASRTA